MQIYKLAMTQKHMVKKLKCLVFFDGTSKVSNDLGFRSGNTVMNWIRNKKIPKSKVARVEQYLRSSTNGNA